MVRLLLAGLTALFIAVPALAQKVQLQVIHNSADPATALVDVYVNGERALQDFAFRSATAFLEFEPGVALNIALAPSGSMSVEAAIKTFTVTLPAGRYVGIVNGVVSAEGFAANPNELPITLELFAQAGVPESAAAGFVNVMVFHGATDAPAVDVYAGETRAIEALPYGSFSSVLPLPASIYQIGVAAAGSESILARYLADVSDLAGQTITIVASGFLIPDDNKNGPAFGLFAATSAGGPMIELPLVPDLTGIRLQIIHNAADPAAALVDVYVNGFKLLDDFAFRTATPFVELPAGVTYQVAIAPASSDTVTDALATFDYDLEPGTYIIVANGVLNTEGFASNADPNAAPIAFDLYPIANARTQAAQSGNVDVLVFHGATDAPAVDILAGEARLLENVSYGQASNYLEVPAGEYILGVAPTGGAPIALFRADLVEAAGAAVTVLASGFLNPEANNDGPAFGLFAALPTGGPLRALEAVQASVSSFDAIPGGVTAVPNPSAGVARLDYVQPVNGTATVNVYDVTGNIVYSTTVEAAEGATSLTLPLNALPLGSYRARVVTGNYVASTPVVIVR